MSFNTSKNGWHAGKLASIDEETTKKFSNRSNNFHYSDRSVGIKSGRSLCFYEDDEYISTKIAIDPQSEQAIYNKATSEVRTLRRLKSDKIRPATTMFHSPLLGLSRSHTTTVYKSKEIPKINRRNTVSPDKSSQKLETAGRQISERGSLVRKDVVSLLDNRSSGNDEQSIDANSTVCVVSPSSTKGYKSANYSYSASSEASSEFPSPTASISGDNRCSIGESENENYKSSSNFTRSTSTNSRYSSLYRHHSFKLSQQNRNQYYTSLYSKDSSSGDNNMLFKQGRPILLSVSSVEDYKDKLSIETVASRSIKITRPYFTILTTCIMVGYFILTMVYNFKLSGK